jgi:hypothetical protein
MNEITVATLAFDTILDSFLSICLVSLAGFYLVPSARLGLKAPALANTYYYHILEWPLGKLLSLSCPITLNYRSPVLGYSNEYDIQQESKTNKNNKT